MANTAHNLAIGDLGLYRFLSLLPYQRFCCGLKWQWGCLESARFLPRVTHRDVVLVRAQWRLDADEVAQLTARTDVERVQRIRELRHVRSLPRFAELVQGDNTLFLDLENVVALDTLATLLRRGRAAVFRECLPMVTDASVSSSHGLHVHQVVIPLESAAQHETSPWISYDQPREHTREKQKPFRRRSYSPGSEWLFLKLYCSPTVADRIMLRIVAPLIHSARRRDRNVKWFFVRYADPHPHLRVRLRGLGDPDDVMRRLNNSIRREHAEETVHRIAADTYLPETERYGGLHGMQAAEGLFAADSDWVLHALKTNEAFAQPLERFTLAFATVDKLWSWMGLDLPHRHRLAQVLSRGLAQRLRTPKARSELSVDFRRHRRLFELARGEVYDTPLLPVTLQRSLKVVAHYLEAPAMRFKELRKLGRLNSSFEGIASSLAHMHINRMLRFDARRQEAALYGFLLMAYESDLARHKVIESPKTP